MRKSKSKTKEQIISRCKELGISRGAYYQRLYYGWSEEEAFNMPKVEAVHRTKDGEPVFSYLKQRGKDPNVFYEHVKRGWSTQEALEMTEAHVPYARIPYKEYGKNDK
jgi:hypothetical protein